MLVKDLFPNTRVEVIAMSAGSALGAVLAAAVGGFDQALTMLTVLVIVDYFSGIAAAFKTGQANSKVGFVGIIRKIVIYVMVAFAYVLDGAMQINILRSMVIFAYAANEGLSIIENADRLGYGKYIPVFFRNKVQQLRMEKISKEHEERRD